MNIGGLEPNLAEALQRCETLLAGRPGLPPLVSIRNQLIYLQQSAPEPPGRNGSRRSFWASSLSAKSRAGTMNWPTSSTRSRRRLTGAPHRLHERAQPCDRCHNQTGSAPRCD